MGKRLVSGVVFGAVLSLAWGCGPSLKSTMPVPKANIGTAKGSATPSSAATYLYVDDFLDKRESPVLVRRDKKEVTPEGDVASAVVDALKQALAAKGFELNDSAPVIISGEVREWVADVSGSLPTKVSAQTAIFIEVLDPANKRIYSGTYRGLASLEEASINEKDVSKTLASSLEEAVGQVTSDRTLISLLSSY